MFHRGTRSITRGLVELLRSQDTCAVGCTSGRSSEIDETKVARNTSLKRHKTDLNSKGRDNTDNCCSSLSPPRDERKILFLISVN